jgi:hypothetical protein
MDDERRNQLRLEAAKRKRSEQLELLTREYELCDCTYPIQKNRNISGHSSDCPAHAWIMERREQSQIDREAGFASRGRR